MRVALFVHQFFPDSVHGTETYTLDLARNLGRLGHDPVVVAASPPDRPKKDRAVSRYTYRGIPVILVDKAHFPAKRPQDAYYQPEMRPLLRGLLEEIQPDVVHVTHLIHHTAALLDAIEDLRLPVVATLVDFYGLCRRVTLEAADGSLCGGPDPRGTNCLACAYKSTVYGVRPEFLRRKLGNRALAAAWADLAARAARVPGLGGWGWGNDIRAVTERADILMRHYNKIHAAIAMTKFLKEVYAANGLSVPIHEIRYGTDLPRLPKPARPADGPIRFGFIGQIAHHKGPHVLVEAFGRLPAGAAELHLFGPMVGYPAYLEGLERSAAGRAVHFRGPYFQPELISYALSQMDFLVVPSLWHENAPQALINALAGGTPAIVSDVAGMTEFVEPGKNGYVFARGDAADLERVLRDITENPKQALGLSKTTDYPRTAQDMTEDVIALYEKVLLAARSPSRTLEAAASGDSLSRT